MIKSSKENRKDEKIYFGNKTDSEKSKEFRAWKFMFILFSIFTTFGDMYFEKFKIVLQTI